MKEVDEMAKFEYTGEPGQRIYLPCGMYELTKGTVIETENEASIRDLEARPDIFKRAGETSKKSSKKGGEEA